MTATVEYFDGDKWDTLGEYDSEVPPEMVGDTAADGITFGIGDEKDTFVCRYHRYHDERICGNPTTILAVALSLDPAYGFYYFPVCGECAVNGAMHGWQLARAYDPNVHETPAED